MAREARGRRRILVAEDDHGLARFIEAALREAGHEVVAEENGYEALARGRNEQFDLLVTDVMMPGLTGDVLARELRAANPGLPVLFVTGSYGAPLVVGDEPLLAKPFTAEELRQAVDELA
jgi:CheY-like chemotaxis protein